MSANPCKLGHTGRYVDGGCKQCHQERSRVYYQKNKRQILQRAQEPHRRATQKDYMYRSRLKRVYGLTFQQYDALFTSQGGRCAICRSDDPGSKLQRWHIDHCHSTGVVRGILCAQCNVMIAMAREDGRILAAGIRYLAEDTDAAH